MPYSSPPPLTGFAIHANTDFYYAGYWHDGLPHGKGTRQLACGLMEHGEFDSGALAMGHRAWPNGDFEDGRFLAGELSDGRRRRNGHLLVIEAQY